MYGISWVLNLWIFHKVKIYTRTFIDNIKLYFLEICINFPFFVSFNDFSLLIKALAWCKFNFYQQINFFDWTVQNT
jgi:hypothetical protein